MKQFSKVTPAALSAALARCASDRDLQEAARSLGRKLAQEDGTGNAVKIVDDFVVKELDTGRWRAKFEQHTQQLRDMQARSPLGCLAWIARLLCSPGLETNRFLPRLAMPKDISSNTEPHHVLSRGGA